MLKTLLTEWPICTLVQFDLILHVACVTEANESLGSEPPQAARAKVRLSNVALARERGVGFFISRAESWLFAYSLHQPPFLHKMIKMGKFVFLVFLLTEFLHGHFPSISRSFDR